MNSHSPPAGITTRQKPRSSGPSVVVRLGACIAAITSLAAVSIVASITVVELSSGKARAINLAGSLRMQSYVILAAVSHAGLRPQDPDGVRQALSDFDLRYRSQDLIDIIPDRRDDPVRLAYDSVSELWTRHFRPAALTSGKAGILLLQADTAEMVTRIDRLVALLEHGLESKLQLLRFVQGISLILLVIGAGAAVFQLKAHVLRPLDELLRSARQVRQGDFSIRVPPREPDELGQLGEAFNFMVADLAQSYARLESRVREKTEELARSNQSLKLLYRTTHALSERAVTRATLLQVLHDMEQVIGLRASALCLGKPEDVDFAALGTPLPATQLETLCKAGCQGCDASGGRVGILAFPPGGGSGQAISVPLFDGSRSRGALLLLQSGNETLAPWQIELLETVGRHVGAALASSQRNEESHRLALLDERSVIARELHDSLAQSLSYLKIQVTRLQALLRRAPPPAPVEEVVGELRDGLNEAYRQLRELLTTFRLRIDGRGLNAAIDETVQAFRRRTGIEIALDNRLDSLELGANREIHVLQIVREALSNIERHAQAGRVSVSLAPAAADRVRVTVDDDGVGFDDATRSPHRYGIVIMRDRAQSLAGTLDLVPRPGGGTRVEVDFPAHAPLRETTPPAQESVS